MYILEPRDDSKLSMRLAKFSFICFFAVFFIAIFLSNGQSPLVSIFQLVIYWQDILSQGPALITIRVIYILGIWCGLRSFWIPEKSGRESKIAMVVSFIALMGIVIGLFLPRLHHN